MRCHQCDEALTEMKARGRGAFGCSRCHSFWLPTRLSPRSRDAWVGANHFTPLGCPGCETRGLRLGAVGNRSVYRCAACDSCFAEIRTGSAAEFALDAFLLGCVGSDLLTCALS